jgi:hypothetical protein
LSETPASDDDLTGEPQGTPPGEHEDELSDEADDNSDPLTQEENAETSLDQPSQ